MSKIKKKSITLNENKSNRYSIILERIFLSHYKRELESFVFTRQEIESAAEYLQVTLPKNIGDIIYSARYRTPLPAAITKTASNGKEWLIEGAGRAKYRFVLAAPVNITPNTKLYTIKIPDATPEIIATNTLSDEQALLAKVRYNRLVDIFLGITAYSLQNHLRTTVKSIGQIEIDEIYVGVDKFGRQFVIPIQAKRGTDKHGVVQTQQDITYCETKFPALSCRALSAQFISSEKIAMFELTLSDGEVQIVDEKHYQFVVGNSISIEDLGRYASHAKGIG